MEVSIPKSVQGIFVDRGKHQVAEILFYDDRVVLLPLYEMSASNPVVTKYLVRTVLEPKKEQVPYRLNLSDDRLISFELWNVGTKDFETALSTVTWVLKRQFRPQL